MARKKLIYTHLFPYHITARSNNQDWFYLPLSEVWKIFCLELTEACFRFHLQIHAFVLMNNHYHMICSCSKKYPLSKVMEWVQRSVNRKINTKARRINHVFGGPYKGSLITSSNYFFHALRYVYQNPVKAGLVEDVRQYEFSSLNVESFPLTTLCDSLAYNIPKKEREYFEYLNQCYSEDENEIVKKAVGKTKMKWPSQIKKKHRHLIGSY